MTDWLPEDCWDNITELDKLPGFHGVIDSFEVFSKEWKEWYLHPEPETQPLIGMYNFWAVLKLAHPMQSRSISTIPWLIWKVTQ